MIHEVLVGSSLLKYILSEILFSASIIMLIFKGKQDRISLTNSPTILTNFECLKALLFPLPCQVPFCLLMYKYSEKTSGFCSCTYH